MKFQNNEIKELLPTDWYASDNIEMNTILSTEQKALNNMATLSQRVQDSSLITLCDEESLALYEDMFKVAPNPYDSIETRRERVLIKLRIRRPFNYDYMIKQADSLIGRDNYNMELDGKKYSFVMGYKEGFEGQWIPEFNNFILVTLPANLQYAIRLNYSDTITLTHEDLLDFRNVKYFRVSDSDPNVEPLSVLGDPLESYYNDREEEVEVSVSNKLLNSVAQYIKERVVLVKFNGGYPTDKFINKETVNNTTTLEFNVPESVKTLKYVTLYDQDGAQLAIINTNVDTTYDTRIKYKIKVEGKVS